MTAARGLEDQLSVDLDAMAPDERAARVFAAGGNRRSGPVIGRPMVGHVDEQYVGASEIPFFLVHVLAWRDEFAEEGHGWLWAIRGTHERSYRAYLEAGD